MTFIEKAVTKAVEFVVFDVISPVGCIAVKGREGLREVISRRKEWAANKERGQKEAASKEEKK